MRSKCNCVSATEVTSPFAKAVAISAAEERIMLLLPKFVGLGSVVLHLRAHLKGLPRE